MGITKTYDIAHKPPHETAKRRVYDESSDFVGNYKTSIGKEKAHQHVIDEDLEEVLVSGPFRIGEEGEMPPGPSKFFGCGGSEDLAKPDVRTLVGAAQ